MPVASGRAINIFFQHWIGYITWSVLFHDTVYGYDDYYYYMIIMIMIIIISTAITTITTITTTIIITTVRTHKLSSWTRSVSNLSGVSSLRKQCRASNTRPSSSDSRYFCSSNKNLIFCNDSNKNYHISVYFLSILFYTVQQPKETRAYLIADTKPTYTGLSPIAKHWCALIGHIALLSEVAAANQALQCHVDASLGLPSQSWWKRRLGHPCNSWLFSSRLVAYGSQAWTESNTRAQAGYALMMMITQNPSLSDNCWSTVCEATLHYSTWQNCATSAMTFGCDPHSMGTLLSSGQW